MTSTLSFQIKSFSQGIIVCTKQKFSIFTRRNRFIRHFLWIPSYILSSHSVSVFSQDGSFFHALSCLRNGSVCSTFPMLARFILNRYRAWEGLFSCPVFCFHTILYEGYNAPFLRPHSFKSRLFIERPYSIFSVVYSLSQQ